jgi:hypothetical protein
MMADAAAGRVVPAALFVLMILPWSGSSRAQDRISFPPEIVPEWEVVGDRDAIRTVYIAPEGLRDSCFVAQVLKLATAPYADAGAIRVLVFDDRRHTPQRLPMSDESMLHLKAEYERNTERHLERFVWISVVDATASPPKLKRTPAAIRPGSIGPEGEKCGRLDTRGAAHD